jgi:hypothetical protein
MLDRLAGLSPYLKSFGDPFLEILDAVAADAEL